MRLSITASLIREVFDWPKEICKTIGYFLGTDMFLVPGDRFSKIESLGCDDRRPHTVCMPRGQKVKTYEVLSVTPCFANLRLVEEYRLFSYCFKFYLPCFRVINVRRGIERMNGVAFCQNDHIAERYAEAISNAVTIQSFYHLRYDAEKKEIIVCPASSDKSEST